MAPSQKEMVCIKVIVWVVQWAIYICELARFAVILKTNTTKRDSLWNPTKFLLNQTTDRKNGKQMSEWVEILWGFTKAYTQQILTISAVYLDKQKKYVLSCGHMARILIFSTNRWPLDGVILAINDFGPPSFR